MREKTVVEMRPRRSESKDKSKKPEENTEGDESFIAHKIIIA